MITTLETTEISAGPDIVPGQLTDLNLQEGGALTVPEKAELKYSRMPVSVSQLSFMLSEIREVNGLRTNYQLAHRLGATGWAEKFSNIKERQAS